MDGIGAHRSRRGRRQQSAALGPSGAIRRLSPTRTSCDFPEEEGRERGREGGREGGRKGERVGDGAFLTDVTEPSWRTRGSSRRREGEGRRRWRRKEQSKSDHKGRGEGG